MSATIWGSGDEAATNITQQSLCPPGASILVERQEIDKMREEVVLDGDKHQEKNQGRRMGNSDGGTILEVVREGSLNRLECKGQESGCFWSRWGVIRSFLKEPQLKDSGQSLWGDQ